MQIKLKMNRFYKFDELDKRREENEKLKRDLETKTTRLVELVDENQKFKDQLTIFQKQIQTQEKLIENLKKKTH